MGVLRLGFITIFLSEPLISGYTTGAACHVFTSQLTHITGVSTPIMPGLWSVPLVSEIKYQPHYSYMMMYYTI
jgi:MFS superfamily sulfate permease-like transporter